MKLFKPKYKKWYFPSGEVGVQVEEFITDRIMVLDYAEEKDIMVWLQIIDSYNRHAPAWPKTVYIPYFPYGRQDKLHNKGEAVSFDVLKKILKSLNVPCIYSLDLHSDSDEIEPINVDDDFMYGVFDKLKYHSICFPDKSAQKHGLSNFIPSTIPRFPVSSTLNFNKKRENGAVILELETEDEITGKSILINDDICDGGATFIECAKILKEKGAHEVHLFVTHGIFSKGLYPLYAAGIEHIYTTNSYCRMENTEKLTVIDIFGDNLV